MTSVITPVGVFPGAPATYVSGDGTLKAATILATAATQDKVVKNKKDGSVAPPEFGNVHVRVISLTGAVYNRFNIEVVSEVPPLEDEDAPEEDWDEDYDEDEDRF